MAKKQATLRDVSRALEKAQDLFSEIERRVMYDQQPALTFEQKVIVACRNTEEGHPLKDFLTQDEIHQAIMVLGDIYTVTGVTLPGDVY